MKADILSKTYDTDMNKAELVITRQQVKELNERYALKEQETIQLTSDLLKVKEELKRAIDVKEETLRKFSDQQNIFEQETSNLKNRTLDLENEKQSLEEKGLVSCKSRCMKKLLRQNKICFA